MDLVGIFAMIVGATSLLFPPETTSKFAAKIANALTVIAFLLSFLLLVTEKLLTQTLTVYYYFGLLIGPIVGFLVTLAIASIANALSGKNENAELLDGDVSKVGKFFIILGVLTTVVSIISSVFTLLENHYDVEIIWDSDDPEFITGVITACIGTFVGGILIGMDDDTWDTLLIQGFAVAVAYVLIGFLPVFLGKQLKS